MSTKPAPKIAAGTGETDYRLNDQVGIQLRRAYGTPRHLMRRKRMSVFGGVLKRALNVEDEPYATLGTPH